MSKAAKATEPAPFEDALARLESIVETMEAGELALDQLLSRYEEGTRLVQHCQQRLAAAELRIRQLEPDDQGEPEARDLDVEPLATDASPE